MPSARNFWLYWYFHVPNLMLAAMIYLLLGRVVLTSILDRSRSIVRVFASVTDPVVRSVAAVTPRIIPARLLAVLAIVWLLAARIALFLGLRALGLGPTSLS